MIKRGIMEVADVVVVNKADGATELAAQRAAAEFKSGLRLMQRRWHGWQPHVLPVSAHTGHNLQQLTRAVEAFVRTLGRSGELQQQRGRQMQRAMQLNMQASGGAGGQLAALLRWPCLGPCTLLACQQEPGPAASAPQAALSQAHPPARPSPADRPVPARPPACLCRTCCWSGCAGTAPRGT
jgi:hypothetical protein